MKKSLILAGLGGLLLALIALRFPFRTDAPIPPPGAADAPPALSVGSVSQAPGNPVASAIGSRSGLPRSGSNPSSSTLPRATRADAAGAGPYAASSAGSGATPSVDDSSDFTDSLARKLASLGSLPAVLAAVDMADPAQRALAVARLSELEESRMNAVLARAAAEGIPLEVRKADGRIARLHGFRPDGTPLYRVVVNANAAISSGASQLPASPYSLTGSAMKVAVWDEGSIRGTHQELTGRITLKNASASLSDHSTHVAGTIAASGVQAAARGMAPAATIDSYDWNDDYTEMSAAGAATASAATAIPFSNHSYGYDGSSADMGRYETEARSVDAVAASLPYYLPFWAAGNEQDLYTSLGGYQSITFTSLAKNILTVGAVNDAVSGGARSPSVGTMSSFSSWGPCDDGRIKPDLVANGVGVYSGVSTGNTAYDTYDGTSMATPSALGSAALVEQLYKREFSGQLMRASLLKAVLIHAADDLGTAGPDYKFGWGLINVKAAADLVLAHKASLASPKLIEGSITTAANTVTHTFTWDGSSPIRATLAWTDPAGAAQTATDSRVANLVHNLDLTLTAPDGTVHRPFVMPFVGIWTQASMASAATTGKNNVDNVEQVRIAAPSLSGNYTVSVAIDGSLTTASQAFALVVTGGTSIEANPAPTVALTSPASGDTVLLGASVNLAATATDKIVGGADGVVGSVEFFVDGSSLGVDTAAPYALTWTPASAGSHSLAAIATDSEGASAPSASVTVSVLTGDGTPAISGFTPSSGAEGATVTISGANLADVTSVTFNGAAAASYTVTSLTSLSATVPAGATSGAIGVVTSRGAATSASSFTVELAPVLISQIYGGGGQSGATLNADYVELRNRGASPVALAGWTVQYASASGTSWQSAALSGTIQPGGYYLLKLSGGASGSALPAADATGSINMSASNGKLALRNTTTAFTGASPIGQTGLQDFVGYGTAAAYEGSGAAPSPSTTAAIFRAGGGATDTGDNSADFASAAPNPRNSSGTVAVPAITSATSAGGTLGSSFTYQILASNAPTAYSAAPLPAGLSVNTATGLISGTPTVAGTTSVTLGATNAAGTGSATLAITITASGGGTGTIFSENMGTPSGTTTIAANTFQNASLAFAGTADVRATTPSSGYTGASGGGDVFFTNAVDRYFEISGINTTGYTGLQLNFGHYKSTAAANNELAVEVSSDGSNYTTLSYSRTTGTGTTTWALVTPTGTIPATANLRIRFRQTSSTIQFRVDDVKLTGTSSAASPVIALSGTPAALTAIYGSTSTAPTSFTVSATDLTAPVTVNAPAGFELSQTAGGASGYASSQSVGASGALASTTLYVRLAAGPVVGAYSGDITATSAGAQPRTLAVAESEIRAKLLTITAQDRAKIFGDTLALGTGSFTASGLVGSETVGSVTLSANGGTGAYDAIGAYVITPSAAVGSTFSALNYDISYQPGTLTVAGLDFASWIGARFSGASAATDADPDGDGLANLLEFYLGLDPTTPDSAAAQGFVIERVGAELRYTYRRGKAQSQYAGHVEWTDTLGASATWSTDTVIDELVSDQGAYELRRTRVPLPAEIERRFLRIKVEAAAAP